MVSAAMQTESGLLTWAAAFEQKPKYVFVVHGNDESCESLTDALNTQLGLTAKAPYSGSEFDLIKGVWIKETEPVPVEAETQATRKATAFTPDWWMQDRCLWM